MPAIANPDQMDELTDYVLGQLEGLGVLRAKKMFGGVGLYCDELFFALIGHNALWMKVDDTNRADYEAAGMEAFRPDPDKADTMNYWELPSEVLEQSEEAIRWARKSLEIARRAKTAKKGKASRSKKRRGPASRGQRVAPGDTPITKLRNLGPVSAAWLRAIGIETRANLEEIGAIGAFLAVSREQEGVSLNLLYALEAALHDLPINQLPAPLKAQLRKAVDR